MSQSIKNSPQSEEEFKQQLFDKLVNDPHPWIRTTIATHPNLQSHHLDTLTKDTHPWVRAAAATHPKLQSHQIEQLIKDPNQYVQWTVSSHPIFSRTPWANWSTIPTMRSEQQLLSPRLEIIIRRSESN